jgi:Na+/melibiose symporter-like transporter
MKRASWTTVLAYGAPIFALSAPFFVVQFYLLNYGTDVLGIGPAVMGGILALSRVWDAISDPVAGTLSDRTRTRLGRRRPWMLAAAPACGLFYIAVWSPPSGLSSHALQAWILVALLLYVTAFTAWMIPHLALGAELSEDYHERSRIFGVRSLSWGIGVFLSFVGMQIISTATAPRAAASTLSRALLLPTTLLLLLTPLLVRERTDRAWAKPRTAFRTWVDVFRNSSGRRLLAVWGLDQTAFAVQGVLAPFFIVYILKRPDLIGIIPLAFFIPSTLTVPIWIAASRRLGKRETSMIAMALAGIGFGGTWLVGENDLLLDVLVLVLAGAGSACVTTLGPSMLADVIDEDELETGERKDGVYASAWLFTIKTANAAVALVVGFALDVSGFVAGQELVPVANITLRGIVAWMPLAAFAGGVFLLRSYTLDESGHGRIRRELVRQQQQAHS